MTVAVTGTFLRADQSPEIGEITFRPWLHAVVSDPDPVIITRGTVTGVLDSEGVLQGVSLVASDDPDWQTDADVPYEIVESFLSGGNRYFAYINAPGPVDLSTVQPTSEGEITIYPTPVEGPTGPMGPPSILILDASDPIPEGTAAGTLILRRPE